MRSLSRIAIAAIATVVLAACGSGGSANGTPGTGAGACAKSTATGTVQAGIANFALNPTTVTAKVGDVFTWTNAGPASHTATLDNVPACDTGTLASGVSGSLTFTAAGTYPFHCTLHPAMKGRITISG